MSYIFYSIGNGKFPTFYFAQMFLRLSYVEIVPPKSALGGRRRTRSKIVPASPARQGGRESAYFRRFLKGNYHAKNL